MKKLASFALSLLLCLSLLPGQAHAVEPTGPVEPAGQVESLEPKGSDELEPSIMPTSSEWFPEENGDVVPKH